MTDDRDPATTPSAPGALSTPGATPAGGKRKPGKRRPRRAPRQRERDHDQIGYGRRHQGRILAMQVLYEVDLTGHALEETLERVLATEEELVAVGAEDEETGEAPPLTAADRALHDHVRSLVRGAIAARPASDRRIEAAAPAFPIDRVPVVDRNVLRLAVYELFNEPEVPTKVAINEAVELAKRFGGESSSRFVNGVLGTIADQVGDRATPVPPAPEAAPPAAEAGADQAPATVPGAVPTPEQPPSREAESDRETQASRNEATTAGRREG